MPCPTTSPGSGCNCATWPASRPTRQRFPDFNDGLRRAMKTETELFFQSIVSEDRSILDFLDAKYTFLNEPLAKHYGIEGVQGDDFRASR